MKLIEKHKYSNHAKAYRQIIDEKTKINSRVIKIGFDYIKKISGTLKNDEFFDLRNSLTLRLQSIFFHYNLLSQLNISGQGMKSSNLGPILATGIAIKQEFLFDSIIFNTISFFDYLSCFLSFIIFNDKKSQWQSVAHKSRTIFGFKETEVAKTIDNLDRIFVTKLNQYRSELIHYSKDNVGVSTSFHTKEGIEKINVFTPLGFTKKFKKEFKNLDKNDLDLNTVIIWMLDIITEETSHLLTDVEGYIETNRVIKKGKEIIKFKNE